VFEENGWKFVAGLEPDEPEDISDLKLLLNTPKPAKAEKKIGRNEPCPCGSGKKYKKCCGR
jgi:SWIM/SEC-C metal-binding protein